MRLLAYLLLFMTTTIYALKIGAPLPSVTLQGDAGGRVDGTPFVSDSLRGKVYVVFYVDPDEKDLNNPLSDALKAQGYDRTRFASVAIINMAATWLPNFAINASLEKKQEKFPHTLYVKDLQKVLVSAWSIADDESDIIVLDREGRVLFVYEGRLDETQIQRVITLVGEHL